MKHFLFLVAVGFFVLTACENTPPNPIALIKEIDANGDSIHYQMDTVKKVKLGSYKRFYKNGKLALEQEYRNDTLIKVEKFYYEDGQLKEENTYNEVGEFEGPTISYYPSGKKKSEGTYVKNALDGTYKVYYESGKLKEFVTMKNSEENGPFEEYAENGNLLYKGTFNNKKEYCLLEEYNKEGSGELVAKRLCRDGQCCTIWTAENGPEKPKNGLCEEIINEMVETCKLNLEELVQ